MVHQIDEVPCIEYIGQTGIGTIIKNAFVCCSIAIAEMVNENILILKKFTDLDNTEILEVFGIT